MRYQFLLTSNIAYFIYTNIIKIIVKILPRKESSVRFIDSCPSTLIPNRDHKTNRIRHEESHKGLLVTG